MADVPARWRMLEVGWRMYRKRCSGYHLDPMDPDAMKARTKAFALRVIKLTESLPATRAAEVIGRQLLRSPTSVGANSRASRRARCRPDFVNKLGGESRDSLAPIRVHRFLPA